MARIMTGPLYPEMCGAVGDGVTDDTAALQRWGSSAVWMKSMQRATYNVCGTINMNGELGASLPMASLTRWGIDAPPGATINETCNNVPIMTAYGSRGFWHFPHLQYATPQTVTFSSATASATGNIYSVGLMIEPYPGDGGLYMSDDISFRVDNAAVGFGIPKAFSDTVSVGAASATNTLTLTNSPTDFTGARPWVPQMYIQVKLETENTCLPPPRPVWQTVRIKSISGNVLTLADSLCDNVAAGAAVVHSTNVESGTTVAAPVPVNNFSNTYSYAEVTAPTLVGWYDGGAGTQNVILNRYIRNGLPADNWHSWGMVKYGIWEGGRSQDVLSITNLEHFTYLGSAWIYQSSDGNVVAHSIHFEGARLVTDGTALMDWATNNATIDALDVAYTSMLADNSDLSPPFNNSITNGVAIFKPGPTGAADATESTTFTGRGIWIVNNLTTQKNIVDSSANPGVTPIALLVRQTVPSTIDVDIKSWNSFIDGGFVPAGQLVYPVNGAGPIIENRMPAGTSAYLLRANTTISSCTQRMLGVAANFNPNKILVTNGSAWVSGAPAGGLYTDSSCSNLLTSSNTLSANANTTTAALVWPFSATAQSLLYNIPESNNFFFRLSTAGTTPLPINVTAGSSYLTGRNGGNDNTDIAVINLGLTPSPSFVPGQRVQITGSANPGLSGTVQAYVTEVPDSTHIVLYVESGLCTTTSSMPPPDCGTAASPKPETAMNITVIPTVDVFVTGDKM